MPRRNPGPKLHWRAEREEWEAIWYVGGKRRRHSFGTRDDKEAKELYAKFIAKNSRPEKEDPRNRLIDDVLRRYADEGEFVAAERVAYCLQALLTYWSGKTVADITIAACKEYRKERKVAAATVARELSCLNAAIRYDHREGRLAAVPIVWTPRLPPPKDTWLPRQQIAQLIRGVRSMGVPKLKYTVRVCSESYRYLPYFIILSYYFCRRSEAILSLRTTQVNFDTNIVDFRRPGLAETNKRRGVARIPRRALIFLKYLCRNANETGHLFHRNGKAIKSIRKSFKEATKRAGLVGATPHILKHSGVTALMQSGIDKWEVSGFTDTSLETLERVYGHHHPDYQKAAANAHDRK